MKRLLLTLAVMTALMPALSAQSRKTKTAAPKAAPARVIDTNEISWVTLDQAQELMKKEPRKVYIDVYTSWCGWCKVMDKKTFTNKGVIKYMNTNFYAVKLDAEQKDSIHFMGNTYGFTPENRANDFAVTLLRGQMSYPTTVIMEENFQNPQIIPGYQEVKNMEAILKFLGNNVYKTTPWETYMKSFQPEWQ